MRTPDIGRLAAQGGRFSNALGTTPIRMSNRATLLTGMNGTAHGYTGGGPHFVAMPDQSKRHCDDRVGDHPVEFLRAQPKEAPFCLYLSFNIAHARDDDHRPGIGHYPWPQSADE
jgi:hypothetical protein